MIVGKLSRDLNHMDQKDDSWDPTEMYRQTLTSTKATFTSRYKGIAAVRVTPPKYQPRGRIRTDG